MKSDTSQIVPLSKLCSYSAEKVLISALRVGNYISTENMLPSKRGIALASSMPAGDKVCAYRKGDILVSNIRPYYKKIWRAVSDGGCSNDVLVFRAHDGVDSAFLYYVLADDAFFAHATKSAKGTKMPRGDKRAIMDYTVRMPNLPTQRKIASILSSLDDKIENNNAICKNLEEQAAALYKSWFVDFEPFGGKKPQSWKYCRLDTFTEIKRGSSPRPINDYIANEGLRWLKISDVTSVASPFIHHIKEHIKKTGLSRTVFLQAGSLVLSNSATPGIPKILDVDTCIHDGWLYFPNSSLSNEFLYLLFKQIRPKLICLGNGSVFTNLKTEILKSYEVLIPDSATLLKFDSLIHDIFKAILNRSRENQHLATIRETILPKLMSGEVEVDKVAI